MNWDSKVVIVKTFVLDVNLFRMYGPGNLFLMREVIYKWTKYFLMRSTILM